MTELLNCPFCGGEAGKVFFLKGHTPASIGDTQHSETCPLAFSWSGFYRPTPEEAITAWNTRTSDAEITRLTEALRAAEKLLAEIKGVSDVILAPICAASGRYIYDWAACPDMIEELYSEDVCIPAKAFHDLYMATNYDIVVLAQALAGAKP